MDDLGSKINEILSDPKALEQIQELSSMLMSPDTSGTPIHKEESLKNNDMSFLGALSSPQAMSLITKVAPLLSDIGKEDDTSRLLSSLRPFLSDQRKEKLDEASKLIKVMKMLSMLKDTNLLDSFL